MAKIHINQATKEQLDYAVAVAQGFEIKFEYGQPLIFNVGMRFDGGCWVSYHPTTSQAQCGELIDKYLIQSVYAEKWFCNVVGYGQCFDKSRLVAACKAYLLSVYPDGMIDYDLASN